MSTRNEDFYRANDEARVSAHAEAFDSVVALNLADSAALPPRIQGMGWVVEGTYAARYSRLHEQFKAELPMVVALAVKCYWYAAYDGALWYKHAIARGVIRDTPEMRERCTPAGYVSSEGGAWNMYNKLAETASLERVKLFAENLKADFPSDIHLLEAIGLYWLREASSFDGLERLNLLGEAHIAFELAHGVSNWDAGYSYGQKDALESPEVGAVARKALAREAAAARVRNDPRAAAKAFVRSCWEEWQQKPSRYGKQADFARDMLDKQPVLVSQAVIEGWCREWRRNRTPDVNPQPPS